MPPECYGEWESNYRAQAEKNIGSLIQRAHKEGVKAHKVLLQGLADDAIIEAAKRLRIDLIVIGTHGHQGLSRLFAANVATHVVLRYSMRSTDYAAKRSPKLRKHGAGWCGTHGQTSGKFVESAVKIVAVGRNFCVASTIPSPLADQPDKKERPQQTNRIEERKAKPTVALVHQRGIDSYPHWGINE